MKTDLPWQRVLNHCRIVGNLSGVSAHGSMTRKAYQVKCYLTLTPVRNVVYCVRECDQNYGRGWESQSPVESGSS
jgi:hypothetical protein